MKYQFTTEGSEPQTKYYAVGILGPTPEEGMLFSTVVSTPLTRSELIDVLDARIALNDNISGFSCMVEEGKSRVTSARIIGLDSICRIISNIKPIKVKVRISIEGEAKTYTIDAEKLDTLLKSLE